MAISVLSRRLNDYQTIMMTKMINSLDLSSNIRARAIPDLCIFLFTFLFQKLKMMISFFNVSFN